jgi:hypothetical protein
VKDNSAYAGAYARVLIDFSDRWAATQLAHITMWRFGWVVDEDWLGVTEEINWDSYKKRRQDLSDLFMSLEALGWSAQIQPFEIETREASEDFKNI